MMLTVYDVQIELEANANPADVRRLKDHFRALSINVVGLDWNDLKARSDTLTFSIYGHAGPFMMKRIVMECAQNIFPDAVVGLSNCR